jgi:hypothetical protein
MKKILLLIIGLFFQINAWATVGTGFSANDIAELQKEGTLNTNQSVSELRKLAEDGNSSAQFQLANAI